MISTRSDMRNGWLCVLVCMAALLGAWPFSSMAFNDDWTWAFTVKRLQETGHLTYNGWSSPTVIAQAYWGLMWVKFFGFSFNVLRASSLPMAAGAVGMTHGLARRAGLAPGLAVFVALMLGLSPVFVPMACTFMTDVPGLFFILLSMYAIIRGSETSFLRPAMGWLSLGAAVGLVGGSSRQVVWIVPLVLLPYVAWLRRSDRWVASLACVEAVAVFSGAMLTQHWFALQPYSIPDPPGISYVNGAAHHPLHFALGMIYVALTMVLLLMPAAFVLFWSKPRINLLVAGFIFLILFSGPAYFHQWLAFWLGNIVTSTGVLGSIELFGNRPPVIPNKLRELISLAAFAILSMLLAGGVDWIARQKRDVFRNVRKYFAKPAGNRGGVQAIVLTSIALVVLEMTRAVFDVAYDRHLLPLIPLLGILLLLHFQRQGRQTMPIAAWAVLIGFGIVAFGFTQEVNALARARAMAINRLKAAGIDETRIDAGFEPTYWLQVSRSEQHYVNDARLRNPPGAYDKNKGPTPVMDFAYRLERKPTQDTEPSEFGTVQYFSILRPFHRTIYIDRFIDPWWHDVAKSATRPDRQLLPDVLLRQYQPAK